MSSLLTSVLALALVVSLALIAVIYGPYVVVTAVQVTSIIAYVIEQTRLQYGYIGRT